MSHLFQTLIFLAFVLFVGSVRWCYECSDITPELYDGRTCPNWKPTSCGAENVSCYKMVIGKKVERVSY